MYLNYHMASDYQELSTQSAAIIIEEIKKNPQGLYCFAGGDTPVGTLKEIVRASNNGEVDLSQAYFIVLDEWIGIKPSNEGSCFAYLKRNIWEPLNIQASHIHAFNSEAEDLAKECQLADDYITSHDGLALTLLGVGVNGHLGFNEPGASFDSNSHVINLDPITQRVGQKYFTSDVDRSQGITLGIKQLLASKRLIIQASGPAKYEAVSQLLGGNVTETWPITSIWKHPMPDVIVDRTVFNKI